MAKKNGKLGVALLGMGNYASQKLAPALKETRHCYLAGVITSDLSKAVSYDLKKENIYTYDDFDSIKDNADIDVVYIVTPSALHADYAIRAAKAGKHVICEKPLATTIEDCDRIISACINAGVTLSVGYRLHFEPHHQQMMHLGQTHKFGYIQKVIAKDGLDEVDGWRLNTALAGEGGPLMDVGIYCLQAANYIYNMSPIAVSAQQTGDIIYFQLEYAGGFTAECECSYSVKMDYLHAAANNGWFELEPAFSYDGIKGKTSLGTMQFEPVNQQALEMDCIAKAILAGKSSPVPGEMGREDVGVLLATCEALRTGERVLLDPVVRASATTETGGAINGSSFVVQP
ncbi:MAG: Gfo/Idh/MocA family oxidoreductase [Chitinophagaceae bacterium]